jgi:hypothetical protein
MNIENRSAQLIRPSRHTKPRIPAKSATSFRMTVHCVFSGIDYTKNIDAKFAKNISTIYKNSDAFYQKYYCLLHIKHAKLMHQTLKGV